MMSFDHDNDTAVHAVTNNYYKKDSSLHLLTASKFINSTHHERLLMRI